MCKALNSLQDTETLLEFQVDGPEILEALRGLGVWGSPRQVILIPEDICSEGPGQSVYIYAV